MASTLAAGLLHRACKYPGRCPGLATRSDGCAVLIVGFERDVDLAGVLEPAGLQVHERVRTQAEGDLRSPAAPVARSCTVTARTMVPFRDEFRF
jgi:hypothetical protein